jgi:hypothetical protein
LHGLFLIADIARTAYFAAVLFLVPWAAALTHIRRLVA